jgi:hypothetical protein
LKRSNTFLIDHNLKGQAVWLWGILSARGWLELVPLDYVTFETVGLPINSNDRLVWRFAQEHQLILLTANRNMKGQDSLEQTIREENTPKSLPVVTVANRDRLTEPIYRERCAVRLVEIVLDLEQHLGTERIFIP